MNTDPQNKENTIPDQDDFQSKMENHNKIGLHYFDNRLLNKKNQRDHNNRRSCILWRRVKPEKAFWSFSQSSATGGGG